MSKLFREYSMPACKLVTDPEVYARVVFDSETKRVEQYIALPDTSDQMILQLVEEDKVQAVELYLEGDDTLRLVNAWAISQQINITINGPQVAVALDRYLKQPAYNYRMMHQIVTAPATSELRKFMATWTLHIARHSKLDIDKTTRLLRCLTILADKDALKLLSELTDSKGFEIATNAAVAFDKLINENYDDAKIVTVFRRALELMVGYVRQTEVTDEVMLTMPFVGTSLETLPSETKAWAYERGLISFAQVQEGLEGEELSGGSEARYVEGSK